MYKTRFILSLFILLNTLVFGQDNPKREIRGFWISTVHNLDWPSSWDLSTEEQQKEFIAILDRQKANGMNAVFFQVRPQADAFYKSDIEPWSQWLCKKQGKAPDPYYDPLEFAIKEAHKRNMELHAWFNLFRGVSHPKWSDIQPDHISKKKPKWFYTFGKMKLFDPGYPEVKDYLISIVSDVVKRYDIDGVHLDDYFYPVESKTDTRYQIHDANAYKAHQGEFDNIRDWRRYNINILIKQMNDSIKHYKKHVRFGVSPFPVWRHKWTDKNGSETNRTSTAYDAYYADTRKWIKAGWVDYLAPQFYWGTKHDRVNFNKMMDWWDDNTFDRHVYAGVAFYKVKDVTGDANMDPSWKDKSEIYNQLKISREHKNILGNIYYRAASFTEKTTGYEANIRKRFYSSPAIVPSYPWLDSIPPLAPFQVKATNQPVGVWLSWQQPLKADDGDVPTYYAIYRFENDETIDLTDATKLIGTTRSNGFIDSTIASQKKYTYLVTSFDRVNNESVGFAGTFIEVK